MKSIFLIVGPRDAGPGERALMLEAAEKALLQLGVEDHVRVDVPARGASAGDGGASVARIGTNAVDRRGDEHRWVDVCAGVPLRRPIADDLDVRAVVALTHELDLFREHRAGIVAPETLRVAAVHHGEHQIGVEPTPGVECVLRIDRQAWRSHETARLGHGHEALERRPRALGIDVVGGDGRDPAPVVDTCVEQHPEVVLQSRNLGQVEQVDDAHHAEHQPQ